MKMKKFLCCGFAVLLGCVLAVPAYAESNISDNWTLAGRYNKGSGMRMTTISQGAYVGGGVLGTVFGFGIGHAVQGRWLKTGWVHTVLQGASVAVLGLQAPGQIYALTRGGGWNVRDGKDALALIASLVFLTDKIWEIIDVWVLPSSYRLRSQGGFIESPESRLNISPALYSHKSHKGLHLSPGLNVKWKF